MLHTGFVFLISFKIHDFSINQGWFLFKKLIKRDQNSRISQIKIVFVVSVSTYVVGLFDYYFENFQGY